MAQLAREELFAPDEIACVHVINRAVRRCFLMGDDLVSGKNFDHRIRWMQAKLKLHAAYFGIDLLGSAIMSNHFHLVLRSRPDVVRTWDDAEVARRWRMLCPLRKHADGTPKEPTEFELNAIRSDLDRVREIRSRLSVTESSVWLASLFRTFRVPSPQKPPVPSHCRYAPQHRVTRAGTEFGSHEYRVTLTQLSAIRTE